MEDLNSNLRVVPFKWVHFSIFLINLYWFSGFLNSKFEKLNCKCGKLYPLASLIPFEHYTMSKIYAIQLLTTAVIGAYVSFVLLFVSRQNKLLDKLLGIFTLTMSLFCLLTFAISLNWAPDFVVLIRTFFPLYYFIPAVSYLYLRSYLRDATSLSRKDLIHALPIFLHLIYVSPLVYNLLIGDIQWTEMISKVDRQSYFFNYGPISDRFHVVFRICIMLLYCLLSWRCYFSKLYRNF